MPQPQTILLASLIANGPDGCDALARRLRLSNTTRARMSAAENWALTLAPDASDQAIRALVFRAGPRSFCDAVLLAAGNTAQIWSPETIARMLELAADFVPPKPPVTGRDLLALGIPTGRYLGVTLDRLSEMWIASDFTLTKQELLANVAVARD
jgi:poly(A) polymerase